MTQVRTRQFLSHSCADHRHHHCCGRAIPLMNHLGEVDEDGLEWIPTADADPTLIAGFPHCDCACHDMRLVA